MRIEGTYTFAAPLERVFAALAEPEVLARAVPGCERVMQLGPAGENGTMTLELRLRAGPGPAVYTTTAEVAPERDPARMVVELRGLGPAGQIAAHGTLRLSEEGEMTRGLYRWECEPDGLSEEQRMALGNGAGQRLARSFCDGIAATLGADGRRPGGGVLRARTPRGHIIALPRDAEAFTEMDEGTHWPRPAVWMSAGLVVGLGALALTISLARRLRPRDEDERDGA